MYRKKEGIEHSNYNWDNVKNVIWVDLKSVIRALILKSPYAQNIWRRFFLFFLREVTSHKPWSVFDFMLA